MRNEAKRTWNRGYMEEWRDGLKYGETDGRMERRMKDWRDGWMRRRKDNEYMDGRISII